MVNVKHCASEKPGGAIFQFMCTLLYCIVPTGKFSFSEKQDQKRATYVSELGIVFRSCQSIHLQIPTGILLSSVISIV